MSALRASGMYISVFTTILSAPCAMRQKNRVSGDSMVEFVSESCEYSRVGVKVRLF